MGCGIDILHEEGNCLAVNKPGGLLTQAPPDIDCLETRIKRFLASRTVDGQPVYLGVPHRLDRHVSGAMVFATRKRSARAISQQFEGRLVRKIYWAVVEGIVNSAEGTWTDFIKKVPDEARAVAVPVHDPAGREATLRFKRLATGEGHTHLEIQLETGRMHQIRVQCAMRGHPVLGDQLYGSTTSFGPQTEDLRLRWIGLHAHELRFFHPRTDKPIEVVAPLPECWRAFDLRLG